ncbi:pro-resilin, partial [Trifolium medium]|nr:pro-resilin [Trifolium medium]
VEKPQLQDSTIKETSEAYEDEDSEDGSENDDEDDDDGDYNSGSSYGSGFVENEIEKEVVVAAAPPQYPSGYGLEAMDICE